MPSRPTSISLDPEVQKNAAKDIFNYVWTMIENPQRSKRETDLMVHAAHASRFLWEEPGEPVNHARGEWQISHVYAIAERIEPALFHARRCLEICQKNAIGDFDLAYAYEALARAHATAGDLDAAAHYESLAREEAGHIADSDDREHFLADLESLPGG